MKYNYWGDNRLEMRFDNMYIIVGLGNPTDKYAHTRHNVGFDTIDYIADKYGITMDFMKHKAICGKGIIEGEKVILAKPMTYMNLSGESVRELVDYYKVDSENEVVIIYDDISLDVEKIRVKRKGSAGGHNGIKNIILYLGSETFVRIKVGVGKKPPKWDLVDYVLARFSDEDRVGVDKAIEEASDAVVDIITHDVGYAMNNHN